jgi:asparagine synthase (glutamine-hydrolysing)
MCGIAGFSGHFSPSLLTAMGETIAYRGPDDRGEIMLAGGAWHVGLAHRRLSIIDLSSDGHQPMTVRCGMCGGAGTPEAPSRRLWLTYNGEIYNYRELRRTLESKGHDFRSRSDSEVLLHLYAEEGIGMLQRLNGIFAFALYDGRPAAERSGMRPGDLFLARDGLGVKPLYYTECSDGFLFASELKALLQCPDVPRELDPVALHSYLAYLWAPAPRTMLKGIRKLPPGQAMLVRDGRVARQWTFYDLPYGQSVNPDSEADIAAELRDRLQVAVGRQMVADVPVGAFLSGGLDSSAVVAMMRRVRADYTPTCYCISFAEGVDLEGTPADLPYAQRVARRLGVDLCPIEVQPDVVHHLERMLYHLDEPQADVAPINVLLIAEQARRDGIKVLLSGAGGDDIFSGYRRHWALNMERMWGWLPQAVRAGVARLSANVKSESPWARRIKKVCIHAALPPEERLIAYFYWSGEQVRRALYSPDLADELQDCDTAEPLRETLRCIPGEVDPLNRMLYLEAKHFLADHNLNFTDKASMAAGVEVRVPLLDRDLIDFAARIPTGMKQKGRVGKAIFKRAMEPFLPHDVIYRAKSGFGAPLRRWLRDELREMADDVLSSDSLHRRGLFDPGAVHRLVEMDRAGRIDGTYTIFSLICIELWCRMFVDKLVPSVLSKV